MTVRSRGFLPSRALVGPVPAPTLCGLYSCSSCIHHHIYCKQYHAGGTRQLSMQGCLDVIPNIMPWETARASERKVCAAEIVSARRLHESIPPAVACDRACIRKGEGCSQRFAAALYSSGKKTEELCCDRCEGEQP